MKNRRLLANEHNQVLQMFEMGLSQTRIAESMGVPLGAVKRVVRSKYPDFQGRKFLPVKDIVSKYKSGASASELADAHETTIATIQSRLTEAGIELRPAGEERRKHFFNNEYFEVIDTEDKAYWLGFLFADGNVSARMKDVSIVLADKDRGHLEKFLDAVDYEGPGCIMDLSSDGFTLNFKYSKVSLRSTKMAQDLVDKGCLPNKSIDCGAPLGLPDELTKDFLRGLVDGDGYVSARGLPSIEIVGAYPLLEWVGDVLSIPPPRPHKSIWRVRASGARAVELMRHLYKDSSVYLDRKKERAEHNYV